MSRRGCFDRLRRIVRQKWYLASSRHILEGLATCCTFRATILGVKDGVVTLPTDARCTRRLERQFTSGKRRIGGPFKLSSRSVSLSMSLRMELTDIVCSISIDWSSETACSAAVRLENACTNCSCAVSSMPRA